MFDKEELCHLGLFLTKHIYKMTDQKLATESLIGAFCAYSISA